MANSSGEANKRKDRKRTVAGQFIDSPKNDPPLSYKDSPKESLKKRLILEE